MQALDALVGLRAVPAEHGGYRYTHKGTGYTFELRPASEEEAIEPGQQDLVFIPLSAGQVGNLHSVACLLARH